MPSKRRRMWVNTEQTWRMKISSLLCSFLGAGASCWSTAFGRLRDKQFVRRLVLVLWRNASLWLETAIRCHQANPLSGFFMSRISNCLSLFLSWWMAHRSALPSCPPDTDFSPSVLLDLATAPGCLLSFCFTVLFLLIQTTLI